MGPLAIVPCAQPHVSALVVLGGAAADAAVAVVAVPVHHGAGIGQHRRFPGLHDRTRLAQVDEFGAPRDRFKLFGLIIGGIGGEIGDFFIDPEQGHVGGDFQEFLRRFSLQFGRLGGVPRPDKIEVAPHRQDARVRVLKPFCGPCVAAAPQRGTVQTGVGVGKALRHGAKLPQALRAGNDPRLGHPRAPLNADFPWPRRAHLLV